MRNSGVIWGGLLILLGILLLLNRMGILSISVWMVFWPLALIIWGLSLLVGAFNRGRAEPETENLALQLKGYEEAAVAVHYGAGRLMLDSGAAPDELLSGVFEGGVKHRLNPEGEVARVELSSPIDLQAWNEREWDVRLNGDIPLTLDLEIGAAEAVLNLTKTRVRSLKLRIGAGKADVILPASAGETEVHIEGGAGAVMVSVPDGVAVRIDGQATLGKLDIDETRFPSSGTGWQSEDYDDAPNHVSIKVRFGMGEVSIR